MQNAENLAEGLKEDGKLLVSGLLKNDEFDMISAFTHKNFLHISTTEKNGWICILFTKK